MKIETRPFALSKFDYFSIMFIQYFRQRWWMLIGLIALAIVMFIMGDTSTGVFFLMMALALPLIASVVLLVFINLKQNKKTFAERRVEITDTHMTAMAAGGGGDSVSFNHIKNIRRIGPHYLFYLPGGQFIHISRKSFKTEQDAERFESILRDYNL